MHATFPLTLAALMMSASGPACADVVALDSASLELGAGAKVQMLQLDVQSRWEQHWFASNLGYLGAYWDGSLARWRGNAYRGTKGAHQSITVIGLTPVLRYQAHERDGWYGELGIGCRLMSSLYNNNRKRLSTPFEFGDHLGAGYVFSNGWEAGLKLQHFSNGGIKQPNSGVNFAVLKLGKAF